MLSLRHNLMKLWELAKETVFPKSAIEKEISSLSQTEITGYFPKVGRDKDRVSAILSYKNPRVRKLIEMIKYKADQKAVNIGAILLLEEIASMFEEKIPGRERKFILIGVPASKRRLKERGFDQNKLLGEEIMELGGENFLEWWPDLIFRIREVGVQSEIKSRKERLKNMENVFGAKSAVKGRTVVLIDDVTTTGSTLKDARRALRAAGAKKTYCLSLAH